MICRTRDAAFVRATTLVWVCFVGAACREPPKSGAPVASSAVSPADVTLTLAAVCEAGATEPSALRITLSVPEIRRPVFRLDDNVMGSAGVASLILDATATDQRGPVPLVRRIHEGVLELAAARDVSGKVALTYQARSVSTSADGALEGLRHDATGIGGHGRHFVVLPDLPGRYRMRVSWAASQCPGTGMSTFGDSVGELSALREAVYYWGTPQQTNVDSGSLHLRTAWFGKPALDVSVAGAWAAKVFAAERAFFLDEDPTPYSVFVRVIDSHGDRANGIGQETSYLSWIGPRTTFARRLKVNIAHEMLHRWLGLRLRLQGPEGTAYWFSEGFTVHYSNVIAFRAGLLSVDEFLESINDIATRHFNNKRADASNDVIRRDFFRDPDVSIVPYTRGALYAAELDGALRAQGKRTLDEVMRELYANARNRDGLRADAVRQLVERELGKSGVERYDAVIVRGEHPLPAADAYGPCFTRKARKPNGFEWVRVSDASCRD
jgi:hypothetical protein